MHGLEQGRRLLSPKLDFVFKLVFGDENNVDILRSFLAAELGGPGGGLGEITIVDPNLRAEALGDKFGVLDLKVRTADGGTVIVEVQLAPFPGMVGRAAFYTSKSFAAQLGEGQRYRDLRRVVTVVVADYDILEEGHYHNSYLLMNRRTNKVLTDLLQIDFLELRKLPAQNDGRCPRAEALASSMCELRRS